MSGRHELCTSIERSSSCSSSSAVYRRSPNINLISVYVLVVSTRAKWSFMQCSMYYSLQRRHTNLGMMTFTQTYKAASSLPFPHHSLGGSVQQSITSLTLVKYPNVSKLQTGMIQLITWLTSSLSCYQRERSENCTQ